MKSRADRLRDGVARFASRVAEHRAKQLAKREALTGLRAGADAESGHVHDPAHDHVPASGPATAQHHGPAPASVRQTSYVPAPPGYPPSGRSRPEPASVVPWGVRVAAETGWRLLILAGVVWVLIQMISTISLVVLAFSAALLITALLQPTAARLRGHGVAQGLATAIMFITGFVVMGLIGWFVVWQVSDNLPRLTDQIQHGINDLKHWAVDGPFHVSEDQINHIAQTLSDWLGDNSKAVTSAGLEGVTVLIEFLSGALLTMFCTLFLLYDGERIWKWVLRFVPRVARGGVAGVGPRAWGTLTGYVRGTVIVAMIDAIFIGVGLWFLNVPMAVPLAVFIFLFAFIPIVGAVISGALAVLVAIVTNGVFTALLVLAVVLLVQQIEGHVLQPFILGRLVRVHPLGVVLSVTGGSLIAGIPGAVVAVPLVAVLNTTVGYLRAYDSGTLPRPGLPSVPPSGAHAAPAPKTPDADVDAHADVNADARGGGEPATEPSAAPTESADPAPPHSREAGERPPEEGDGRS